MDATPTTTSHPRWLDHAEQQTWPGLVGLFVRLPAALESDLQRLPASLSSSTWSSPACPKPRVGPLRMSELAGHANSSLSRLSHVVARLEKRGWVRRAPWGEDGRHTIAILQQDGHDKLVASAPPPAHRGGPAARRRRADTRTAPPARPHHSRRQPARQRRVPVPGT